MVTKDLIEINNKEELNQSFDPSKINLQSEVHTIYNLITRMRHEELIAPDYQREKEIWNEEVQSRLVESLIVRIPIPVLYLDATNDDQWMIVDGLQRLSTLKKFIDQTERFVLNGLEYLTQFNGYTFNDLPRQYQRRILETQVPAVLIKQGTPENVKFNIFKRLNTGGAPLTDQEIRHALNIGSSKSILDKISQSKAVKKTIKNDIQNERMELNELILRGFGYWFFTFDSIRMSTLDVYLVNVMKELNKHSFKDIEYKVLDFYNVLICAEEIFGDRVFRKISGTRKNKFNKNVYETWVSVLSIYTISERTKIVSAKSYIISEFERLLVDRSFNYAISSRKSNSILSRNEKLHKVIAGIL
ncbi:DUF262 domain-containing protein [Acinetobacter bereziniae]|uniref:DUF262 domain-containing protein n=1 Tax=Acinetobacter bereziniae TaxID=106648 RepID=UPI00124FE1DB|nr:DUF262 domain-containing protein [Acinetobacter bereziniae]